MDNGYLLKQFPEDFVVTELLTDADEQLLKDCEHQETEERHSDERHEQRGREKKYVYFLLEKRSTNTLDALRLLSRHLRCSPRELGFCGLKDKQAVTKQYCSAPVEYCEELKTAQFRDFSVRVVGSGDEPMYLGRHKGNVFSLVLRRVRKHPKVPPLFLNFFGKQRFGIENERIGKALVQGNFAEAVRLVARQKGKDSERLRVFCAAHPKDAVAQARSIPLRLLRLYVHAYQAFLWNRWVFLLSTEQDENREHKELANKEHTKALPSLLPLPGFRVEEDAVLARIFKEEGITSEQFLIRQIPSISAEPLPREVVLKVHNLVVGSPQPDEKNSESLQITLSFWLEKSSYATVVVDQLFS